MAIRVFNALSGEMGGIDWAGLPIFIALWGIEDVEGLIDRLLVIKSHKPPQENNA